MPDILRHSSGQGNTSLDTESPMFQTALLQLTHRLHKLGLPIPYLDVRQKSIQDDLRVSSPSQWAESNQVFSELRDRNVVAMGADNLSKYLSERNRLVQARDIACAAVQMHRDTLRLLDIKISCGISQEHISDTDHNPRNPESSNEIPADDDSAREGCCNDGISDDLDTMDAATSPLEDLRDDLLAHLAFSLSNLSNRQAD